MAGDLPDQELGRRLSAGRGYVRESVAQFAKRLQVDRHELTKWEHGQFGSPDRHRTTARKRQDAVELVGKASGLPPEFFAIDFSDLRAMAETWRRLDEEDAAEAIRAVEAGELADHVRVTEDEKKRGKQ